jgi:uncharacterized cysteine cluster protein YcgN (CxxCxxCC family)
VSLPAAQPAAPWWETTPLDRMTKAQWEAVCDGCGKCCLNKLEDEETGEIFPTNVACRLLDRRSARCGDYANRKALVPECVRLTPARMETIDWLPVTCAYLALWRGERLPDWHHLVCGDREAVHRAGVSVRGWTVSETDAGELEDHIVEGRIV